MSEWQTMESAPRTGELVLLLLGETIPDSPDIRGGTWIHEDAAMKIGDDVSHRGGWLIWNSENDWFVVPFEDVVAWCPAPPFPTALHGDRV